jgi:hypothetical protein
MRYLLIISLFLLSCEKEQVVTPEPEPTCNCGILTDYQYNINGTWSYKARNECSNNNAWVNINEHIQSGGTANIGDYVCAQNPW